MKFIPNSASRKVGLAVLKSKKASPTILFAGGVVGVVATTVLACRATLKLEEVIEETETKFADMKVARKTQSEKYSDSDFKHDKVVIYTQQAMKICKLYAPAFILGTASIAALAGSHNILTKRNAALTAAYAGLEKGFSEYRQRVIDAVGEEKEQEIRYAAVDVETIVEDKNGPKKQTSRKVGAEGASIYARFFESTTSTSWSPYPGDNKVFLRSHEQWANDMLTSRGYLFLNEVYKALGMEPTKAGQVVGWLSDGKGDKYVSFGMWNADDPAKRDFVNGVGGEILLDFNVDGNIFDDIDRHLSR